jgi:serine/threonine-protein kinase
MLNPGTKLGPYEVLAPLGAGGMGEVYRARDTKLDRDVALKVLPALFVSDADRVARFQREAKTLAALNHPNIGGIYGLEEGQGVTALVLELVEGQTLAERIEGLRAKGSGLPIDEALPIARQIAAALEAAHGQGIVHRDLKPANVKLRPDATVKVLDFGLAKTFGPADAGRHDASPLSMSPTLTTPMMTGMGVVMGTAAYMAPEQAKGKPVDKRADIWAFGCVLYEMLAGRRPFDGDDVSDVMATVLKSDPDWTAIPPDVPPHITVLIRRCLEKDARTRVADISVALFLMTEPFAAPAATADRATASRKRTWVPLVAGTAAVVVSAIASVWITIVLTGRAPQAMRFAIVPSAAEPFVPQGTDRDIAVSPDGRRIVYRATVGGATKLVVRDVNQLEGKVLDGTDAARSPFISPDGQWVAFSTAGALKKVAITGGPPITLCSLPNALRGGSWQGDTIVFATTDPATGLLSVPAAGGEPTVLTKPDPGEGDHLFPSVLPDGGRVLFTIVPASLGAGSSPQIAVLDLKTKVRKVVVRGGSQAQYVTSGALVFAIAGTLRAARFNASSAELTSEPVPVLEQVSTFASGAANYAVSRDGMLVYVPGRGTAAEAQRTLVWVGRDGREEPLHTDARAFTDPRLSPDEQRALVELNDDADDIWIVDLNRGALTRQTFEPGEDESAVWMPDGKTIAYASTRAGTPRAVYRRRADGVGGEEPLWTGTGHVHVDMSTPDGRALILSSAPAAGGQFDLMLLPLEGDRKLKPLLQTRFDDARARVSPDGRWIAYTSDETGRGEVYVRAFPSLEGKTQVSTAGGGQPVWAKRGDELFFRTPDAMMTVRVQPGASFSVGPPRKLFDGRFYSKGPNTGGYDVSRDGRFLMVKDAPVAQSATGTLASLIVVVNWLEELKERIK